MPRRSRMPLVFSPSSAINETKQSAFVVLKIWKTGRYRQAPTAPNTVKFCRPLEFFWAVTLSEPIQVLPGFCQTLNEVSSMWITSALASSRLFSFLANSILYWMSSCCLVRVIRSSNRAKRYFTPRFLYMFESVFTLMLIP